ncbi:hypothetical protein [Cognatishimia activa]|uniref:hypothetical protein n=1 Tax=Cognatishimia activa TaxID=1715691 RepID=UPI002230F69F|nr:hypothetical protein [Cognatishimia activa]UZD91415.1 hypothetical protein M0D42_02005 [Cognatishimia activa]
MGTFNKLAAIALFAIFGFKAEASDLKANWACSFDTVCLETMPCSQRRLSIDVDEKLLRTPGQSFPVGVLRFERKLGIVTVLTEPVNGSTGFLTIFGDETTRLTFHFPKTSAAAMVNIGKCVSKN